MSTEEEGVDLFARFETDASLEEDGKWFYDVIGDDTGFNIKVRRMSSQTAAKAMNRRMTQARKFMVKGKLPEDVDRRILNEHLAETILLDWAGVVDPEGNKVPYTPEIGLMYLTRLPDLRATVLRISSERDNFKAEATEEIAGN